jgi:hypothetical protein
VLYFLVNFSFLLFSPENFMKIFYLQFFHFML